jgi:outer membrane protein assembly factor BamB
LYLLAEEQQPRPQLAHKATAELSQPIATSIAVAGQTAFAGDARGILLSFSLPALSPGQDWNLGSPVAWGPAAAGDCVLVATQGKHLYCFDGRPSQRWDAPLEYGPLAGDPVLIDGKIVLASSRGVVWSVNPADGQESGKVELGQPLASAPVLVGDHLIVAGADGVLHRVAKP